MNKEQVATAIQEWLHDDNARVGPERVAIGHNFDMLVDRILAIRASPPEAPREGATPRTKAQCLTAVVKELGLDTTDPFTRVLAAAFALQDAYDESRAALTRCQQIVHEQAAPGRSPREGEKP